MSYFCGHENTKDRSICRRPAPHYLWQDDMGDYPLCNAHAEQYVKRDLPVSARAEVAQPKAHERANRPPRPGTDSGRP